MKLTKKFNATQLVLSAALVCLFSGCYINPGVPGSGVTSTEQRTVDEFTAIDLSGAADVNVLCGQEQSVSVTIDDNLQEIITTEVVDGELTIGSSENYSSKIGLTVDITIPTLTKVNVSGACDLKIEKCETTELDLQVSGAGKVVASGTVETVNLGMSGAGKVDLRQLLAKSANIDISGAAKATVDASDELKVGISGVGKVSYIGDPNIEKNISGLGEVTKIGDRKTAKSASDHSDEPSSEGSGATSGESESGETDNSGAEEK